MRELSAKGLLVSGQRVDKAEILGHLRKADHNLRFVADIIGSDYADWVLTGCYYACYHAALALIRTKGYASKNHLATLCILVKDFYRNGLSEEDIKTFSEFLEYEDVLFYVEAKNKREEATYSTRTDFDRGGLRRLRIRAALFVNRIRDIVGG